MMWFNAKLQLPTTCFLLRFNGFLRLTKRCEVFDRREGVRQVSGRTKLCGLRDYSFKLKLAFRFGLWV